MEAIYKKMLEGKSPDASTTENSLEIDVYDPIIQWLHVPKFHMVPH